MIRTRSSISKKGLSSLARRQIKISRWPKGLSLAVAVLRLEPGEIEDRYGVRFEESNDGLDRLKAAIIETDSGGKYALVRHQECSSPGTEVWIEAAAPDSAIALRGVLEHLGAGSEDVTWVRPGVIRGKRAIDGSKKVAPGRFALNGGK